ncbi:unnamed protein product [Rhizoctonia solani]|uniref:Mediator of RNA polymerase II transcription subunit 20 n=1 Tax=Rhizoctonia solani TaxID=456999 RepID=A0A8H3GKR7_9AGAM|nr:unnamed protein product [Rhizoctonia solani]CAE6507341.1 unnamed protein product [Rhizoctonia solani]
MGVTCIARWPLALPNSMPQFVGHILNLPNVEHRGRWKCSARSFRSSVHPERFLYTLVYGENAHILLEDRKSLERPAALEKIRFEQEAAEQAAATVSAPPMEDDDVIILDAAGQEPGAVLPKAKNIPLPLHFRTTFISLKPPSTFEQFLGQVKAKWGSRPGNAGIEGVTFTIGTDWIIRVGFIQAGSGHKGVMLETEYLPLQTFPPTTDGQPPAILAEFVASIVPQSHADYTFLPMRFSEEQWSEILGSADDAQPKPLGATEGEYSYGFEYATPHPSDWGSGFTQERRSAFLLLRMMLDEKLLV